MSRLSWDENLGLGFCLGVILNASLSLFAFDASVRHPDLCKAEETKRYEWCETIRR